MKINWAVRAHACKLHILNMFYVTSNTYTQPPSTRCSMVSARYYVQPSHLRCHWTNDMELVPKQFAWARNANWLFSSYTEDVSFWTVLGTLSALEALFATMRYINWHLHLHEPSVVLDLLHSRSAGSSSLVLHSGLMSGLPPARASKITSKLEGKTMVLRLLGKGETWSAVETPEA